MPVFPQVSVVIPNYNGMKWLEGCLGALAAQTFDNFETIVVDNGSSDGSVEFIQKNYPSVRVEQLIENTGFANAVNVGIENSTAPFLVLLNSDTIAYRDFLANLHTAIKNAPPQVAAINPQMLQMDNPDLLDDAGDQMNWQFAATKMGYGEPAIQYDEVADVFTPSGGASLYRRKFLEHVGGFDVGFFAYLEDVDIGLRGRLYGYRYLYEPTAKVLHKSLGSNIHIGRYVELMTRNRLTMMAKNIPTGLLLRRAPQLIYGQIYFALAYTRPWQTIKGVYGFIRDIPEILRKRRLVMSEMSVDFSQIDSRMKAVAPLPAILPQIARRISRLVRFKFRQKRDIDLSN